jgi:hypothetical protein
MHGEVVPSKRLSNGKFRVDGWPCSGPGHVYVRFQDHLLDFLWGASLSGHDKWTDWVVAPEMLRFSAL